VCEALHKEGYRSGQVVMHEVRLGDHYKKWVALEERVDKLEHFFVGVRAKLKDK
jgi:hypothetical protein